MIRGITFDKQLMQSQDHAHEVNYYYNGDLGVTKGCTVTENVDGNLVVSSGYFIVKGRLIAIDGSEIITVPSVASGTLYSTLVFEIDLTQTNTTTEFNQGAFKILSNASAYPTLTQQDLDDGGTLYQFEFARFENTVGGIVGLIDNRILLDISRYLTSSNFGQKMNAFTAKTTPVDADMVAIADSAASNASKKLTWANIKATLKAYFDTIYTSLVSPAFTGTPTAPTPAKETDTTQIATTEMVQNAVRQIDVLSKTTSFTLDLTLEGGYVRCVSTSTIAVTVPNDTSVNFPVGTMIVFYRESTGAVTFTAEGEVTLRRVGGKSSISNQYEVVALIKYLPNVWNLIGALA